MPGRRRRPLLSILGTRLLGAVAVVWAAATITFLAVKAIPGDPVSIIAGGENIVDAEQRERLARHYGLDRPVWQQYLGYLARAFTGDFGESYLFRKPAVEVVAETAAPTLGLAATAFLLALMLAFASALLTASRRGRARFALSGLELLMLSTPVYWIGTMLLIVFSFGLGWFPVVGDHGWRSLVLPAFALALPLAATISQVMRDGLEQALDEPFVLTARTRGVSEWGVRFSHALRHSLLAVTTVSGTVLGGILSGSILTETVFGRAGFGQMTLQAISSRDMPLILTIVVLVALAYYLINALVDVSYAVIDPKLRKGAGDVGR
ncbi:Oligopeptide transport system permease protein OppB (TC 3.A.1.5.1) [Gulosibacter sp. 10]|nr:Oligopeptide transport system permease protein OppB (TC 3.A.1.5.1) [Gulosibacter sp. 10]